jgi:hypothetical protein
MAQSAALSIAIVRYAESLAALHLLQMGLLTVKTSLSPEGLQTFRRLNLNQGEFVIFVYLAAALFTVKTRMIKQG